jgi:hypothetical protein
MAEGKKYLNIVSLLVVTGLIFVCLEIFKDRLFQEWTLVYVFELCLFLFAYELSTIFILNKKIKTTSPKRVVSLYMLLKGVKLLLFLAVLVFYMLAVKIETKRFVLVAVAIYFIYLLWDTWFLTSTEKKLKKK